LASSQAIEGFVAIFDDGYYLVRPNGLVVNVDYTAWGWLHLIIGLIAIAVGLGTHGRQHARPHRRRHHRRHQRHPEPAVHRGLPVWSTIIIAVDVIVIYAIVVHGRELKV
jgi:hypothetical protein